MRAQRRRSREAHEAFQWSGRIPREFIQLGGSVEHLLGLRQKAFAQHGQPLRPGGPLDQPGPVPVFKRLDAPPDHGGGQPELTRCPGKAAGPHRRYEGFEILQPTHSIPQCNSETRTAAILTHEAMI